jgi:hypothetical protein
MTAEQKVKQLFPNAIMRWDNVPIYLKDYSNPITTILAKGVWIDNKCIAFGGKVETLIWRRAYKKLNKLFLEKMEI